MMMTMMMMMMTMTMMITVMKSRSIPTQNTTTLSVYREKQVFKKQTNIKQKTAKMFHPNVGLIGLFTCPWFRGLSRIQEPYAHCAGELEQDGCIVYP